MITAYYLSGLAFEILIRPQSEKGLFLPGEGEIEKSDDNELIYGIHKMLEDGILNSSEDGKGFEISDAFKPIVRNIVNAKRIIKAFSCAREYPKYFYISDEYTTVVDPVVNRNNSYRLFVTENKNLAETVRNELELPDEETGISEAIESYSEKILSGEYREDAEKNILTISEKMSAEEAIQQDCVMSIIDIIDSYSGEPVSRLIIYKVSTFEKAITVMPGRTEAPQVYNYRWLEENLKLVPEAKNDNS